VPRPVLRILAGTLGRIRPEVGRQARAALIMDRVAFTHDATSIRKAYPDLPCTPLSSCLQA
jgi:hypothetical protein